MDDLGWLLVYAGLGLAALGGLLLLLGRVPGLQPGQLPGDFSWKSDSTNVYLPLGTMVVVSLVLTALANLVLQLFR